ncbi:MAG TPA: hypothetical protein VF756_07365 [Thermoanaerobaculia bacterium]
MPRFEKLALSLVIAIFLSSDSSLAQSGAAANTWTFSADSSNNLVIQDLSSFSASQGEVLGGPICLQYLPVCPTDRNDLLPTRRRYAIRGTRGSGTEWRIDLGRVTLQDGGGMTLPLEVGVGEKGVVQVVTSEGAWNVDLQRIPAVELRAGDGKRWRVALSMTEGATADGCWIEVQCPARGQQ